MATSTWPDQNLRRHVAQLCYPHFSNYGVMLPQFLAKESEIAQRVRSADEYKTEMKTFTTRYVAHMRANPPPAGQPRPPAPATGAPQATYAAPPTSAAVPGLAASSTMTAAPDANRALNLDDLIGLVTAPVAPAPAPAPVQQHQPYYQQPNTAQGMAPSMQMQPPSLASTPASALPAPATARAAPPATVKTSSGLVSAQFAPRSCSAEEENIFWASFKRIQPVLKRGAESYEASQPDKASLLRSLLNLTPPTTSALSIPCDMQVLRYAYSLLVPLARSANQAASAATATNTTTTTAAAAATMPAAAAATAVHNPARATSAMAAAARPPSVMVAGPFAGPRGTGTAAVTTGPRGGPGTMLRGPAPLGAGSVGPGGSVAVAGARGLAATAVPSTSRPIDAVLPPRPGVPTLASTTAGNISAMYPASTTSTSASVVAVSALPLPPLVPAATAPAAIAVPTVPELPAAPPRTPAEVYEDLATASRSPAAALLHQSTVNALLAARYGPSTPACLPPLVAQAVALGARPQRSSIVQQELVFLRMRGVEIVRDESYGTADTECLYWIRCRPVPGFAPLPPVAVYVPASYPASTPSIEAALPAFELNAFFRAVWAELLRRAAVLAQPCSLSSIAIALEESLAYETTRLIAEMDLLRSPARTAVQVP